VRAQECNLAGYADREPPQQHDCRLSSLPSSQLPSSARRRADPAPCQCTGGRRAGHSGVFRPFTSWSTRRTPAWLRVPVPRRSRLQRGDDHSCRPHPVERNRMVFSLREHVASATTKTFMSGGRKCERRLSHTDVSLHPRNHYCCLPVSASLSQKVGSSAQQNVTLSTGPPSGTSPMSSGTTSPSPVDTAGSRRSGYRVRGQPSRGAPRPQQRPRGSA